MYFILVDIVCIFVSGIIDLIDWIGVDGMLDWMLLGGCWILLCIGYIMNGKVNLIVGNG